MPRVAPVMVPMRAPPALPPAGDAVPLDLWRGKALVTGGKIDVCEVESADAKRVLKLDVPDTGVGEYVDFFQAVGSIIWSHCPNAVLHPENGCMVIDTGGVKSSHDGVGKAVREVKTLVGFMQLIGGDLSHVCAWLNEPLLVGDLNEVLGPAGFRAVPPAPGDVGLPPDVVLRLAACFANRPELLLAMLDVALPRCHEPPKELKDRWSALVKEAPPVPILARMPEPDLHPPTPPRGALASTSSHSDDARSRLSPEPANRIACRRMVRRLAQP